MYQRTKNVLAPVETGENAHLEENAVAEVVKTPPQFYFLLKRVIDVVLSFVGLILLSPLLLGIALCIKLNDKGPIFYFREVVGRNGQCFYALKFRTMIVHADSYLEKNPELLKAFQQNMKLEHDPRVTNIGGLLRKTSLDELPQLYNVLRGQMTLVGPRIIHPSELTRYGVFAKKRLSVKPGITGLWQISGRQHVSYEERVLLDMRYIDERNTYIDLAILVKTLKVLIIHTGV